MNTQQSIQAPEPKLRNMTVSDLDLFSAHTECKRCRVCKTNLCLLKWEKLIVPSTLQTRDPEWEKHLMLARKLHRLAEIEHERKAILKYQRHQRMLYKDFKKYISHLF